MVLADALWLGLSLADWVVIALYFVVILAIGLWSMRQVHDMDDFFMGGRRFGPVYMMFFAFGSGTSSEQAISVVAGTYRAGLAGIWWQFLWLWATPFYWVIAPVMRRMRALTTADFFEARFGGGTATLYSVYGIIMSITFIAGGLFGAGKMINALTGGELDALSRRLDWQVPAIRWDDQNGGFGRGMLFQIDATAELTTALDQGRVPPLLRERLAGRKMLSETLTVSTHEPGQVWSVHDEGRQVSYPVALQEVHQPKAGAASAGGTADTADGPTQRVLRVEGSGWRRVEGYEFAILAMTVLFVTYGMAGGLGAAIITDFIQGILTIAFSFLLLPFVFQMIGGFGELHSEGEIKPGMFDLVAGADVAAKLGAQPITLFYVVMLALTGLAGIVVQPHIMGVCGAGKTEFEGRFGFTFGNFLKRFCTIAWTFTGLACIVWYLGSHSPLQHLDRPAAESAEFRALSEPEQRKIQTDRELFETLHLNHPEKLQELSPARREEVELVEKKFADELFGQAAYDVLPRIMPGLIGLLLASLLAAVMSSSDAQMVVSSGLFTENIYRKHIARNRSQRHYLWVGRIAGLVIVMIALVLQASFEDVIDALKVIIKTPAAIGISLWIGIMWRGWTAAAVWVSSIAAALAWAAVAYLPGPLYGLGLPAMMFHFDPVTNVPAMTDAWQMVAYLSAGVVSGLLVSLVTPRVREERLDRFFRLLHTPVRPGEEVAAPCTLPENPLPPKEKLFKARDIEIPKPTKADLIGFVAAWVCVGLLVWLTARLAVWL